MRFALLLGGMLAAFFLVTYVVTDGYHYESTISALAGNRRGLFVHNFLACFPWTKRMAGLVIVAPLAAAMSWRDERRKVLLIYLGVCAATSAFFFGKDGASFNYLLELCVLVLLLAAIALPSVTPALTATPLSAGMALMSVISFGYACERGLLSREYETYDLNGSYDLGLWISRYQDLERNNLIFLERLAVQLDQATGLDWYLLSILHRRRAIDLTPILDGITHGAFDRILVKKHGYTRFERLASGYVARGPYRLDESDEDVAEYVRVEAGR